ncbi:lipase family protein [Paenibacillus herberti]|uniref:Lipase n=1 Tax=Paenibacillus herberti TaxID=1619309 RepID=A0A229NTF6_9BACL|nr:lipase family protein [Paenibacillus herberti]OXM13170.1 lipase [Paenibacillus herberti]
MCRKKKLSSGTPVMDDRTALFLAAVCGQTYLLLKGTGEVRLPNEFKVIGIIHTGGASSVNSQPFGFVAESPDAVLVAFRGTISTSEWLTDFMADQIDFDLVKNGGSTHRGFTSLYKSLRPQLLELLGKTPSRKPLFLTGHSLGGAISTLAALDLAVNSVFRSPIVYTYASPRVGNSQFAETYAKAVTRSFRVANGNDIVTYLPPLVYQEPRTKLIYYYSHVSELSELDFNGGSFSGNHVLVNYFNALAEKEPQLAEAMCRSPIGWCPHEQKLPGEGS